MRNDKLSIDDVLCFLKEIHLMDELEIIKSEKKHVKKQL